MNEEEERANGSDNGISESELIEVANSLDRIVAKPRASADNGNGRQRLSPGMYVAKVLASYLNKSSRGTIFVNFKFKVYGYVREGDMGECEVVSGRFGSHTQGFSLGREWCVNMLLDLYRDYDVRRTDGEPVLYGGDILRSRGLVDGTWVVITVRNKDDRSFISGAYKPTLKLLIKAKAAEQEVLAESGIGTVRNAVGNTTDGNFDEEDDGNEHIYTTEQSDDLENGEPPF